MGTEVNVFAHLGQSLVSAMKESLFSDKQEVDSDDEEAHEVNGATDNGNTDDKSESTAETREEEKPEEPAENETNGKDVANGAETVIKETEAQEPQEESKPKTITSMYGKVYTLKK